MNIDRPLLNIRQFRNDGSNLAALAARLTELKATVSRTPTKVTESQLRTIGDSATNVLLLQYLDETEVVVGMVHLAIIHLEDRAHLGPIVVSKDPMARGHGTPLVEAAITHLKENYPDLRRLDLSNRPDHDLAGWYAKFGFTARTVDNDDPTTVYRLELR